MGNYWVSVIDTHMNPTSLYLSKANGNTYDTMTASELKGAYTANNGMTLMTGCNSFTQRSSGTWADAVSKAQCSGGTTDYWSIYYGREFLIKYFQDMANGNTASQANQDAYNTLTVNGYHGDFNYDAKGNWIPGSYLKKKLYLAGSNTNFNL